MRFRKKISWKFSLETRSKNLFSFKKFFYEKLKVSTQTQKFELIIEDFETKTRLWFKNWKFRGKRNIPVKKWKFWLKKILVKNSTFRIKKYSSSQKLKISKQKQYSTQKFKKKLYEKQISESKIQNFEAKARNSHHKY